MIKDLLLKIRFKIELFYEWHFDTIPKCKILEMISPITKSKALEYSKNFHPFIYENILSKSQLIAAIGTIHMTKFNCDYMALRSIIYLIHDNNMTFDEFLLADMEITHNPYEIKINGINIPLRLQESVLILKNNVEILNDYVEAISEG